MNTNCESKTQSVIFGKQMVMKLVKSQYYFHIYVYLVVS